jgi:transposase
MDKKELERYIEDGLTLREIGERTGKHLTTVGYWMKRYALRTVGSKKFAPKRSEITKGRLEELIEQGASLNDLSEVLRLSVSSIRHWLAKYDLKTHGQGWRREQTRRAREAGLKHISRNCKHHGMTTFILEGRGYYRCRECRKAAVSKWRREAKRRLVEAAGGCCLLCGYDRYLGALQFHHRDKTLKRFSLSRAGHTRNFAEALEEAKKCILLCANCHAEIEAGVASLPADPSGQAVSDAKVSRNTSG